MLFHSIEGLKSVLVRAGQHLYLGISDSHGRISLEPAFITLLLFMFPVRGWEYRTEHYSPN